MYLYMQAGQLYLYLGICICALASIEVHFWVLFYFYILVSFFFWGFGFAPFLSVIRFALFWKHFLFVVVVIVCHYLCLLLPGFSPFWFGLLCFILLYFTAA